MVASAATRERLVGSGSFPIIDTHIHLFDTTRPQGVPWPDKNDAVLYKPALPARYRRVTEGLGIAGAIEIECSPWLEDNQWVLDLARDEPFIVGLVGHLTPGDPDYGKHLERFAKNPLFRGIRIVQDQLRKGLDIPRFVDDLKLLAKKDLELDVNGDPKLLAAVLRLADRIPDLRIVINHEANVTIDGKEAEPSWRAGISAAARHRNVYCKVSALAEGTRKRDGGAPRDLQFYKPVLDVLWEAFGEDRLLYGSNWPVSRHYANYATLFRIVDEFFRAKGPKAVEKFFWGNSQTAYKWTKR
jgi:L-fuconolactonase